MKRNAIKPKSILLTIILACGFTGNTLSSQSIENSWMSIQASDDKLSLESKNVVDVSIPNLSFPSAIESAVKGTYTDPTWGNAQEILITLESGWKTAVRLFETKPFAQFVVTAENPSSVPFSSKDAEIFSYDVDLGIPVDEMRIRGTFGLRTWRDARGSYTYSAIADPDSRRGIVAACLTHERGVGVFFPGGLDHRTPGKVTLRTDFGNFNLPPQSERPVDTYLIGFFDDARIGLETYADTIAQQFDIQLPEEPNIYCTWYHGRASNEESFQANTEFVAKNLKPFGLNVMQIDDGWQTPQRAEDVMYQGKEVYPGPIKAFVDIFKRYPSGMAHTAEMVKSHGLIPGIWFIPFSGDAWNTEFFDRELFVKNADGDPYLARWAGSPFDLSKPIARDFLKERFQRIHGWGYRYIKVDGLHVGSAGPHLYVNTGYKENGFTDAHFEDPSFTNIMNFRVGLKMLRQYSPDTYILGCNLSQSMYAMGPAFGMVDGMRIGPDNGVAKRGVELRGASTGNWHGTNLYFLHDRVWHNDPDPIYVVPYIEGSGRFPGIKDHVAHWMATWLGVSGAMITTSVQYADLPPERLDLLKRFMPSHSEVARPVDYFENDKNKIWITGNDRMNVLALFNWDKTESTISYDMSKMGLDSDSTYIAFDYWENKFAAPLKGTLNETLAAHHCRLLAVRKATDYPQVISTSRHVTQGLMDIMEENWSDATNTLSGTSEVVAGDPYELRIALPAGSSFQPKTATFGGQTVAVKSIEAGGARVEFTPTESGQVEWSVSFN